MAIVRGLVTFRGVLHAVIGSSLVRVAQNGTRTTLATIGSGGGPLDIDVSANQLAIADGTQLYVWDGATLTTRGPGDNYTPGQRIGFMAQRLFSTQTGSQRFGWSAVGDATSFNALAFASAEAVPDNLVGLAVIYGELLLLGEYSGEVWSSIGGLDVVQRNGTAYVEYGLAAARTLRKFANSAIWLGRNERGQAHVIQAVGYQARPVSTRAIEERFEGLALADASAFVYLDGKQEFYCLNVPGVDTTLCYDTYGNWHERAELVAGEYAKWRPTSHAFAYGRHFFGAADGIIYRLDRDVHTYGSDVKCRSRVVPVVSRQERGRAFFGQLEIVCEKATSGTIMLRQSDDGGNNWSDWRYATAGEVGRYGTRARFNRNGSADDRVFEFRMTDNAPFNPVAGDVRAS